MRKMIGYGLTGLLALAVLAIGVWAYIMSNVEQAPYMIKVQDGAFEIRDYPELVVAEVTRQGDRKAAVNAGFGPLANYIFARERAGDKIPMTAPVTQQRDQIAMTAPVTQSRVSEDEGGAWKVRFIMPSQYKLDALPQPATGDVKLKSVPAQRRAAIRFSGVATDDLIADQEARLRAWLEIRKLSPVGPATYAYYNDPFTPGPLRRNEVLFDVAGN
jgi:DNA gyrase inhibitor GyrI